MGSLKFKSEAAFAAFLKEKQLTHLQVQAAAPAEESAPPASAVVDLSSFSTKPSGTDYHRPKQSAIGVGVTRFIAFVGALAAVTLAVSALLWAVAFILYWSR